MKSTVLSLSAALLLSGTLVGCGANNNAGNDNGAVGNNDNGTARPIGYYSGQNNNNNNADRFGYNNRLNNDRDNDLGLGNGVMNNDDRNDDNGPNAMGRNTVYSRQAQAIANRVSTLKNVQNTSVIVTRNDVIVGIKTHDHGVTRNMKSNVRRTVQNVVQGKNIHVTTNRKMYNRIQNVNNNLQDGDGMNEVSSDIRGIIDDIANAAKRPFQNNNR
ncbi:MAG TPA: YhcN/YlaJ family sporulation lipoprotein [Bacillales bacterium]|nr:YhcN/YlaJ family sporulation lipoprotein [Bacillales bacterium]